MQKVVGEICGAKETNGDLYGFEYTKPIEIDAVEVTDVIVYQLKENDVKKEVEQIIAFDEKIHSTYILHQEKIEVPEEATSVFFTKKNGDKHELDLEFAFRNTLNGYFKDQEVRVHSFVCEEEYFTYGDFIEYDEEQKRVMTTKENFIFTLNVSEIYVLVDGEVKSINSGLYLSDLDTK